MSADLEESPVLRLDFTKLDGVSGVVPCAVQHADSGEVILVAYVNDQATRNGLGRARDCFYRRLDLEGGSLDHLDR